jgi:hypothetical protein
VWLCVCSRGYALWSVSLESRHSCCAVMVYALPSHHCPFRNRSLFFFALPPFRRERERST